MLKLFLTGGTGYIGGDVLYTITKAHPEYKISCLVRSTECGELLGKLYPSIRLVHGSLDNAELLAEESKNADIVCHLANGEHLASVQAIAQGVRQNSISKKTTAVIHLSGSDLLCFDDLNQKIFGVKSNKVYDDWEGIQDIISIDESAPHKDVDMTILNLGKDVSTFAKTAIVCPPTIYGRGRGPGNQRSIQVPELTSHILKRGSGFHVEDGQNQWAVVHIHDLSQLFLKLVEDAANGHWKATWGVEGFYFAENGLVSWGDVSGWIIKEAYDQGYLQNTEDKSVPWIDADQIWPYASTFWGTNSVCKATRARETLGWVPQRPALSAEIQSLVREEAKALGLGRTS